jgi:dTDP-4-amino-4,6-dideoxygalactose transaminase
VFNQYIVRFPEGRATRDRVLEHLKSKSIGCEVYYPLTLPQQKCFADVAEGSYPNSDAAADSTLAIPIYPELTDAQLEEIVKEIVAALP